MPQLWKIGPSGPEASQSSEIIERLTQGGILVLPTDTIYGIHGSALDQDVVSRIFAIKEREPRKALPVLFASIDQLIELGATLSRQVEDFLRETWPAPLTAVVELRQPIPATVSTRTIAARVPAVDWLRGILRSTGPLASTSANRSGEKAAVRIDDIPEEIRRRIDGIVDSGELDGSASTIVDFNSDPPSLVRQGDFVFSQNLWKKLWKTV